MIAPLRQTDSETTEVRRRLHRARRVIASTFLEEPLHPADKAPRIPAWQAWLFTGWVLIAAGAYLASMLGLW